MTYRESLNIGTRADGIIKCTFATIYDADGKGLFSLQRKDAEKLINYKGGYSDASSMQDAIITQGQPDVYFSDGGHGSAYGRDTDMRGAITFDMPLVIIDRISDERLVPAKLTEKAIDVIEKACADVKVSKFIIWKVRNGAPVELYRQKVAETYSLTIADWQRWESQNTDYFHYEYTMEKVISPRYQKLFDIIDQRETVYIKPSAFDWQPVDVENSTIIDPETGQEIKLSDALAAAEKKMQTAKALLVTAGLTAFI